MSTTNRYTVTESTYNGHPILVFTDTKSKTAKPIQMGLKKLNTVVENIYVIKEFIRKNETKVTPEEAERIRKENEELKSALELLNARIAVK